jgi:hypothetical protein
MQSSSSTALAPVSFNMNAYNWAFRSFPWFRTCLSLLLESMP